MRALGHELRGTAAPRRWRYWSFALAFVLAAAACATSQPGEVDTEVALETEADGETATTERATETGGRELVIGAGEDSTELEPPPEANVAMGYGDPNAPVFESLVRMQPDFTIEPLLATSWEFVEPNTWRFELQEGVTFHDGQPFDAEAVVYTVNELWANQDSNILGVGPESAVAVDDLTVEITPTEPNLRLIAQLVHPSNAMIAPDTYPGAATSPENTPTGTGPFKFASYERGNELVVERFEDYWGEPAVADSITFRFMPDDNSRVLALRAGEVHAIYDVPRAQTNELEQGPDTKIARSGVGAYDALLLNSHGEPPYDLLNDLQVRQAVAYGINREAIVQNVWQGNAEIMQTVIPAPVLGEFADMVEGYPYDPEQAAALLDEAGWTPGADGIREKDGRPLELELVVVQPDLQAPMPELVQAQLKEVGIDVEIVVPGDANIYYDRLTAGEGHMFAEVGNQNDANPIFLGAIFTGVKPGGFSDYGAAFGPGGAYDEAFRAAFNTPDNEEVRRLAAEAMHIAVDEYVAGIAIAGIYRIWGLSADVEGFEAHPSRVSQRWDRVGLSSWE